MVRVAPRAIWKRSRPVPEGRVRFGGSVRPAAHGCWNFLGSGDLLLYWKPVAGTACGRGAT